MFNFAEKDAIPIEEFLKLIDIEEEFQNEEKADKKIEAMP